MGPAASSKMAYHIVCLGGSCPLQLFGLDVQGCISFTTHLVGQFKVLPKYSWGMVLKYLQRRVLATLLKQPDRGHGRSFHPSPVGTTTVTRQSSLVSNSGMVTAPSCWMFSILAVKWESEDPAIGWCSGFDLSRLLLDTYSPFCCSLCYSFRQRHRHLVDLLMLGITCRSHSWSDVLSNGGLGMGSCLSSSCPRPSWPCSSVVSEEGLWIGSSLIPATSCIGVIYW